MTGKNLAQRRAQGAAKSTAENLLQLATKGLLASSALVLFAACGQMTPQNTTEAQQTIEASAMDKSEGIIGGTPVQANDPIARSTVMIYGFTGKKGQGYICTGSILSDSIILTAAHCIATAPNKLVLVFGVDANNPNAKPEMRRVSAAVQNPSYNARKNQQTDTGDVALIKFDGGLPQGYIPARTLPGNVVNGENVVLAGYGVTSMSAPQAPNAGANNAQGSQSNDGAGTLRKTDVRVENAGFSTTEVQLDQTNGTGACHGDSGGPAYVVANGVYYLWGVTSRGPNPCTTFSIYTKVSSYNQWIAQTAAALAQQSNQAGPSVQTVAGNNIVR